MMLPLEPAYLPFCPVLLLLVDSQSQKTNDLHPPPLPALRNHPHSDLLVCLLPWGKRVMMKTLPRRSMLRPVPQWVRLSIVTPAPRCHRLARQGRPNDDLPPPRIGLPHLRRVDVRASRIRQLLSAPQL